MDYCIVNEELIYDEYGFVISLRDNLLQIFSRDGVCKFNVIRQEKQLKVFVPPRPAHITGAAFHNILFTIESIYDLFNLKTTFITDI